MLLFALVVGWLAYKGSGDAWHAAGAALMLTPVYVVAVAFAMALLNGVLGLPVGQAEFVLVGTTAAAIWAVKVWDRAD
jgi:hypothetical protein